MNETPQLSPESDFCFDELSEVLRARAFDPLSYGAGNLVDESKSLEFEMLSLQLSIESSRYSFMTMFIRKILNVAKDSYIIAPNAIELAKYKPPFEIISHVFVPHDLWLNHDVSIPNASHKVTLLREANAILQGHLALLVKEEPFLVDDKKLQEFEQRTFQFCFIHTPDEPKTALEPIESPIQLENDLQEDIISQLPNLKVRLSANLESQIQLPRKSRIVKHMPSFQRDPTKGKRKNSLLINTSISPGALFLDTASQSSPSPLQSPHSPNLVPSPTRSGSNFFTKSKLYNKMKSRRELQALALSTSTSGTNGMTTQRPELGSSEFSSIFDIDEAILSERYIENQRLKHAYYVQVRQVRGLLKLLLGYLKRPDILTSLIKLLDFVKKCVFKIILVDVCYMVVNYGHAKVVDASR